ncbi:TetR/AcrR family transcriptional regulator [Halobacillus amylolyticus]|uniref:TetR/AcrR family transcriptional regulator n=1 Tax=Halobacillus amylolyticus TaxID=2932259 RepID=A0ABY4HHE8_9BACI|nr:TetR/AcrR family transcriptional regulator [Halobacillus amylolyticus]UOR13996.1 TetR/AcrR family transcriptional regulator [Halobacillus amylolyticus]
MRRKDARILRTQKWIKEAYLRLLEEVPHEEILVKEITAEADINRATFYKHFHDKHHLLREMVDELFAQLMVEIQSCDTEVDFVSSKQPHPRFVQLLTSIKQRALFFSVMLTKQNNIHFQQRFEAFIKDSSSSILDIALNYNHKIKCTEQITRTFISMSIIGTIKWWIEEDFPGEPEELARYLTEMIDGGIYT